MKESNLLIRILSAVILAPLLVALIFLAPPLAVHLAVSAASGLIFLEVFGLFFAKSFPLARVAGFAFSALLALAVTRFIDHPFAILLSLPLLPILSLLLFMFHKAELSVSSRGPFILASSALYSGVLLGFSGLLFASSPAGSFWLTTVLAATFLGDTGAYALGRLIGGPKLAPRLSPGKTWAGAVGGLLATTGALIACKYLFLKDLSLVSVLVFGPILSAFCQLGDLAESFLKRGLGVKDAGKLIPGHGGLLDRCDALLFSGPAMYIFFLLTR